MPWLRYVLFLCTLDLLGHAVNGLLPPDVYEWMEIYAYLCEESSPLSPVFLTSSEAEQANCIELCGVPTKTKSACARDRNSVSIDQVFCVDIPEICIQEYLKQFSLLTTTTTRATTEATNEFVGNEVNDNVLTTEAMTLRTFTKATRVSTKTPPTTTTLKTKKKKLNSTTAISTSTKTLSTTTTVPSRSTTTPRSITIKTSRSTTTPRSTTIKTSRSTTTPRSTTIKTSRSTTTPRSITTKTSRSTTTPRSITTKTSRSTTTPRSFTTKTSRSTTTPRSFTTKTSRSTTTKLITRTPSTTAPPTTAQKMTTTTTIAPITVSTTQNMPTSIKLVTVPQTLETSVKTSTILFTKLSNLPVMSKTTPTPRRLSTTTNPPQSRTASFPLATSKAVTPEEFFYVPQTIKHQEKPFEKLIHKGHLPPNFEQLKVKIENAIKRFNTPKPFISNFETMQTTQQVSSSSKTPKVEKKTKTSKRPFIKFFKRLPKRIRLSDNELFGAAKIKTTKFVPTMAIKKPASLIVDGAVFGPTITLKQLPEPNLKNILNCHTSTALPTSNLDSNKDRYMLSQAMLKSLTIAAPSTYNTVKHKKNKKKRVYFYRSRHSGKKIYIPAESETCIDVDPTCGFWAKNGECEANPLYMLTVCKLSCHICSPLTSSY